MVVVGDIEDAKAGIEYCNARIRKLEEMVVEAKAKDDIVVASRLEGHLVKWMELLQNYVRMDWQQGGQSTDASTALSKSQKKSRVNA